MKLPAPEPDSITVERLGPGRFAMVRETTIDGQHRAHRIEVANPAFGFAQLAAWEDSERRIATEQRLPRAVVRPRRCA